MQTLKGMTIVELMGLQIVFLCVTLITAQLFIPIAIVSAAIQVAILVRQWAIFSEQKRRFDRWQ